jgi:hypothetical protein
MPGELLKLGIEIGQTLGRQIHGKDEETPIARVEDVPAKPCRSDRIDGSVCCSDALLSAALWLGDSLARPAPNLMARSDSKPDRRMGCPAIHRNPRLGMDTEVHRPRSRRDLWRNFHPRLRAMGIRDRPAPRSPWQNGHTERLIGSIRRERLDHVVIFGERHLRHVLLSYMHYYNSARTHLSLNKDAPVPRAVEAVGRILPTPILGGLHHQYVRI